MTWLAGLRLAAPLLLAAGVWAGWAWIQSIRADRAAAKERVEVLESQIRDTGKQILRRLELETRLEQDRDQIAARLRAAESRGVRIPGLAATSSTAPAASSGDEATACGLPATAAADLGATLGTIYRESSRLAAEADACASQLTTLQEYVRSLSRPK
jgi:hypothetical protein